MSHHPILSMMRSQVAKMRCKSLVHFYSVDLIVCRSPYYWICPDNISKEVLCTPEITMNILSGHPWRVSGYEIEFCMYQPVSEVCELQFYGLVLLIIIFCNSIKLATMIVTLFKASEPPLVTIGDCVATYLERPDENTSNLCLMGKTLALKGPLPKGRVVQKWTRRRRWWFAAASVKRWTFLAFM